jgi:hypothetical protein
MYSIAMWTNLMFAMKSRRSLDFYGRHTATAGPVDYYLLTIDCLKHIRGGVCGTARAKGNDQGISGVDSTSNLCIVRLRLKDLH